MASGIMLAPGSARPNDSAIICIEFPVVISAHDPAQYPAALVCRG